MSSSKWFWALGLCGLLVAVSVLLCFRVAAADVESYSDIDLTLDHGDKDFTNGIGMKLVRIPKGTFMMGATNDEQNAQPNEKPRHKVELTRDFFMGVHEVTQKQYEKVMGKNPSHFSKNGGGANVVNNLNTDDFPVDNVSWHDTQEFIKKLNALPEEKSRRRVYRLPTEAEWEYCCRTGADVKEMFISKKPVATLDPKQANYQGSGLNRTCKVGSYDANPFGLYDMHGNILEWCQDWFGETTYSDKDRKDPKGPKTGTYKIIRGGAWVYDQSACRAAYRNYTNPEQRGNFFGFRVACDVRRD